MCKKDENELLKEQKKRERRETMNSHTMQISASTSFELGDTAVESKAKIHQKLLGKQQSFLLSHKMPHWSL